MSTYYATVKFALSAKTYAYLADLTDEQVALINSDKVVHAVVDSPNSGLTVVEVASAHKLDTSNYSGDYKWIVQLVDTTEYEARQERQRRKSAILKDLQRRKKERLAAMEFKELLAGDEEAEALIKELESL